MRKWLLLWVTVAGAVVFWGLYSLPRRMLDNRAESARSAPRGSDDPLLGVHSLPMGLDLRLRLVHWRKQWHSGREWWWADSLAGAYLRYARMDSALYYARILAKSAHLVALRRGAMHVFRAYSMPISDSLRQNLGQEARGYLEAAARASPPDYESRVNAALTFLHTPEPMRGISALQRLYKQAPEDPFVLFALGRLSLETGQRAKGEEKFKKLLQLHPSHPEGMLYLGCYWVQNGKKEAGRALLVRARALSSDPGWQQAVEECL